MVVIPEATIKEEAQAQASKPQNQHLKDALDSDITDFSFADSLLDLEFIKDFFEDNSDLEKVCLDRISFGGFGNRMEVGEEGACVETLCKEEPATNGGGEGGMVMVKEEKAELEKREDLGGSIVQEMGRVSLIGGIEVKSEERMGEGSLARSAGLVVDDDSISKIQAGRDDGEMGSASLVNRSNSVIYSNSKVNLEVVNGGESDSESDSDGSSSSPSSSSSTENNSKSGDDDDESSDEEEKNEMDKGEVEMIRKASELGDIEEGEIREIDDGEEELDQEDGNKMVSWDDVELEDIDVEDEEDPDATKEPIRSKNEVKVLPSVPPVDATLQPYHQMLPVGVVLSIMGAQVIVEGMEKHNPLNEGSVLWVTEKKSPLGIIDEIFGPVKNPYYVVRYNSESEVPSGIHEGTLISFVPEYANHVLNDKNLYQKGYDASGENDEEVLDEAEFSDDEKEAEYKRMLKMSKRGMNDQTVGFKKNNRKKFQNRKGNWKNDNASAPQNIMGTVQRLTNQNQHTASPVQASMNRGDCSSYPAKGQDFTCGSGFVPPHPPMAQPAGIFPPSNGVWHNGVTSQQLQGSVIPFGFPANNMSWPAQNQLQHPYQMPIPHGIPIQPFNPNQGLLPNAVLPVGQPILHAGPAYPSWSGAVGQSFFNQTTFGMGFQGPPTQPTMSSMNVEDQVKMSNGLGVEQNLQQSAITHGTIQAPQQFNMGSFAGNGRKPNQRGGGRFAGRRGWKPSK